MNPTIIMECAVCKKQVEAPRADYDPPTAVRCVNFCEECGVGGICDVNYYYDANGLDVFWVTNARELTAMETFQSFMDLGRMPNEQELVYVFALLSDTSGMFVADRFIKARKISVAGVACGHVPGHGGDLHFVRHDGGEEAVYLVTELCPLTSVLPRATCGECGGEGYVGWDAKRRRVPCATCRGGSGPDGSVKVWVPTEVK